MQRIYHAKSAVKLFGAYEAASSVAIIAQVHPSAAYGHERISDNVESIAVGWQHLFRKAFPWKMYDFVCVLSSAARNRRVGVCTCPNVFL